MDDQEREKREKEFLNHVPKNGEPIGNKRLREEKLKWRPENVYWIIQKGLVERGIIKRGQGKGGSVRLILEERSKTQRVKEATITSTAPDRVKEAELYEPMTKAIKKTWVVAQGFDEFIVETTAQGGRKNTGGTWTRPDITVAARSRYHYVPGVHFDVITFEIKPPDSISITCVYEALAHLRSATQAYVLLHIPLEEEENLADALQDINAEARRHGIGVITADKPDDFDTWNEVVEPIRVEPDPKKLNDFLSTQFSERERNKIILWFK